MKGVIALVLSVVLLMMSEGTAPAVQTSSSQEAESSVRPAAPITTQQDQQPAAGKAAPAPKQDAQALFEESLRQMMPLDEQHIQQYRERSDQRERALLPVPPSLRTRSVRVSLEPGRVPVPVLTTANVATSLVFHDATGQPWPITSVTNGGPTFFQVLRPELPEGNLLNVMPLQGHATSTLVVTLEKRDVPLVVRLESDSVRSPERKADALVLFQIAHHGPRAAVPLIREVRDTADSVMLAFLDRVPPEGAVRLRVEPPRESLQVWKYGGRHYARTTQTLMWPSWTAVVNGAGATKCYELPVTARIMTSHEGSMQIFILKEGR